MICSSRALARTSAALLCLLLTMLPAAAQNGDPGAIRLSAQQDLASLLDLAAEKLGLDVEYDRSKLQNVRVTLRLHDALSDQELMTLVNQLLAARNLTTVQMPGSEVLTVTEIAQAPRLARIEQPEADEMRAGFVTMVVEIEHRDVAEIVKVITPMLSRPGGAIEAMGTTNLVMISDLTPRVEQAMELIERLDVPLAPPVVRAIPVENLPANQLAAFVTTAATTFNAVTGRTLKGKPLPGQDGASIVLVAPPSEVEYWTALIEQFDQRQEVVTRTYVPRYFPVEEVADLVEAVARDQGPRGSGTRWQAIADALTGSLIVTATPAEHEQVAALIERLDAVPPAARLPVRTFKIRNRDVREILDVLTRLEETGIFAVGAFQAEPGLPPTMRDGLDNPVDQDLLEDHGTPGDEPPQPAVPSPAGARLQSPTSEETMRAGVADGTLVLTADEPTNTLIAMGDPRRLAQIEPLIDALDVRQPQVMIEVIIVSLTDSETLDLGVELEKLEVSGGTLIRLSSLFGLGARGIVESGELPQVGEGFSTVVLNPGDFSIVIRALENLNTGRQLSLPRTLVNNNEEAQLDSVLQQPTASINASDTVATTSFAGTEDAGTQVTVKPQIAVGDHLLLQFTVALSSFVGESTNPALPPPRQQNKLTSKVTIPDGYTVVLGGLETFNDSEAVTQIPLLGSIPLLGEAFKSRSKTRNRSRFFIFIRAQVMRHEQFAPLKYLSDRAVREADIDDGWPEVEPRLIR